MQEFRKLQVWRKAHELTLMCYAVTAEFPRYEMYGLVSQIRRARTSIPTNIAEGCGRGGRSEFSRYLTIALGSASELEYLLLLVHDLAYIEAEQYHGADEAVREIKRMLTGLLHRLSSEN